MKICFLYGMLSQVSFLNLTKFGGLSGCGWILDCALLFFLTQVITLSPFKANLISATVAASLVFLSSRFLVFQSRPGMTGYRLLAYVVYSIFVIYLVSVVLQVLTTRLAVLASFYHRPQNKSLCLAAAKIVVTPPSLLLNFLVAGRLNELQLKGTKRAR